VYMSPACTEAGGVPLITGEDGSGVAVAGCELFEVGGELELSLQAANAAARSKETVNDAHLPSKRTLIDSPRNQLIQSKHSPPVRDPAVDRYTVDS
jgi:hypothetical protein